MKGTVFKNWVGDVNVVWENGLSENSNVRCVSLPRYLETHLDFDVKFSKIYIFRKPLSEYQLSHTVFNHQFVLLRTVSGDWWSIEKNMERFVLKRDRNPKKLLITSDIEHIRNARARGTVGELCGWLSLRSKEEMYNLVSNNCQHFAERVFKQFASLNSRILTNIRLEVYIKVDRVINVRALQETPNSNITQYFGMLRELSGEAARNSNLGSAVICLLGHHGSASVRILNQDGNITLRILIRNQRATARVLVIESSFISIQHESALDNFVKFIISVAVVIVIAILFGNQKEESKDLNNAHRIRSE